MRDLVFEKVGDVNSSYPYISVYFSGEREPFMEIAVNDERELIFTVYPRQSELSVGYKELCEILERARIFLPEALENEDSI